MRKRRALSDTKFAYLLLAPSLILLAALIGYPMLYNMYISVLDVPVNPRKPSVFVGLDNYISVLTDPSFYHSVITTLVFTFVVVVLSTAVGLAMACFLNRKFVGKKLVNSLIILSYVIPSVCLIFAWRYMFNNIYGTIGLNSLFNTPDYIWGRMMAASLVTSLPIVIMYAFSQNLIKSGATEGGVKG